MVTTEKEPLPSNFWIDEIKLSAMPGGKITQLVAEMWQWAFKNLEVNESVKAVFNGVEVTMKKKTN